MYSVAHQKANALSEIKIAAEQIASLTFSEEDEDDAQLAAILSLLEERGKKMEEVDLLDRRMAFLEDSGYTPGEREAERLALEQGTIQALLGSIRELDGEGMRMLQAAQGRLMENIKDIKDGQRSIQAYVPMPEEEEGRQVDTLR